MENIKQLSKERRNWKGAMSRAINGLQQVLESPSTSIDIIKELFAKVSSTYEKIEAAHVKLIDAVEEDEEFKKEEMWMDDVQSIFIGVRLKTEQFEKSKQQPKSSDTLTGGVQNPNDYQACNKALQNEQYLRFQGGQRKSSSVDIRERHNGTPQGQSQPQKHRYSEPNVLYRNISETSIHLEPQQRPVSAPPDKSTFTLPYQLQYGNQTPTYVPYTASYHNRSAPAPQRSYSTTASLVINQPNPHAPAAPWSDPQQRYVPTSNDNHQYNVSNTSQPQENNVISTMHYHRPNNLQLTPTSTRSSAVLKHANTSPMLGRQLYPGRQLNEILMAPNELGTPPPIKPMMSPASSLSSLTDSPEVKPDMKQPPLPLTKEQEEYAYTQALLLHQKMRYERLDKDYEEEKEKLEMLKQEVESMERQLAEKRANKSAHECTAKTITKLSEQNRQLTIDIECMTREIELHKNQDTSH